MLMKMQLTGRNALVQDPVALHVLVQTLLEHAGEQEASHVCFQMMELLVLLLLSKDLAVGFGLLVVEFGLFSDDGSVVGVRCVWGVSRRRRTKRKNPDEDFWAPRATAQVGCG